MDFGKRLRELRQERGIGIKRLAKVLGINYSYISKIESGNIYPSESLIQRISKALDHDPDELMLLAKKVPSNWEHAIYENPAHVASLIRESLHNYETAAQKSSQAPIKNEKEEGFWRSSEDIDPRIFSMYLDTATSSLKTLRSIRGSQEYKINLSKWRDKYPSLVNEDQRQFEIYVILTNIAFSLMESIAGKDSAHLKQELEPELWAWFETDKSLQKLHDKESIADSWYPELFQDLYTSLNDPLNLRKFGKVFTPLAIVEYIFDSLGYEGEHIIGKRVFDPAAGCGIFLLAAARRLLSLQHHDQPTEGTPDILNYLIGFDSDPTSVNMAKMNLLILSALMNAPFSSLTIPQIFCTDSLNYDRYGSLFEIEEKEVLDIKFLRGEYRNGFQWVVGNPPYGKVPSSYSRVRNFKDMVYGHPNIYGMFTQFALEHLCNNGNFGFIVPKSFSSGLYFKRLRSFLLKTLSIKEIVTFESRTEVFSKSDILQETVIVLGTKNQPQGSIVIKEPGNHLDINSTNRVVKALPDEIILGKEYEHMLCITASRIALDIVDKARSIAAPLENLGLRVSTGKFVWNRFKEHLRGRQGKSALPLYWMHNIQPFKFLPDERREKHPSFVEFNDKTKPWINEPGETVIVKRISAKEQKRRIEAAYIPSSWCSKTHGYFLENHLNFIFKRMLIRIIILYSSWHS
jgi:transcriptional regulator with XRE-family HTH domain